MTANPIRCTLLGGALVALAGLAPLPVAAADPGSAGATGTSTHAELVVVAQASQVAAIASRPMVRTDAFPAYQRGVRNAASESNEALRRYVWRTRMIYNFYYRDFAFE